MVLRRAAMREGKVFIHVKKATCNVLADGRVYLALTKGVRDQYDGRNVTWNMLSDTTVYVGDSVYGLIAYTTGITCLILDMNVIPCVCAVTTF